MPNDYSVRNAWPTTRPANYNASAGLANYDLGFRLVGAIPTVAKGKRRINVCGGEAPNRSETLTHDTTLPISAEATPDNLAFCLHKLVPGIPANYGITGSVAPFLHTFKPVQDPDQITNWTSAMLYFKGAAAWFEFYGLQLVDLTVSITYGAFVRITGTFVGDGRRVTISTGFTPPPCDLTAYAYRSEDVTYALKPFGGSVLTGLDIVECTINYRNNLRTDPKRAGGYIVAPREHGQRECTVNLAMVGQAGDTLDGYNDTDQQTALTVTMPNPAASRAAHLYFPKLDFDSFTPDFLTSVQLSGHRMQLSAMEDNTSDTTLAEWPMYADVQSEIADLEL